MPGQNLFQRDQEGYRRLSRMLGDEDDYRCESTDDSEIAQTIANAYGEIGEAAKILTSIWNTTTELQRGCYQ